MSLKRNKKKIIYLVLILGISSCKYTDSNAKNQLTYQDTLIAKWKEDSLGCLHFRNKDIAHKLIADFNILGGDTINLRKVFGTPNFRSFDFDDNDLVYKYRYSTSCVENQIIKESDICYMIFMISNNKVIEVNFVCI